MPKPRIQKWRKSQGNIRVGRHGGRIIATPTGNRTATPRSGVVNIVCQPTVLSEVPATSIAPPIPPDVKVKVEPPEPSTNYILPHTLPPPPPPVKLEPEEEEISEEYKVFVEPPPLHTLFPSAEDIETVDCSVFKKKGHVCPLCQRKFKKSARLKRHVLTHSTERPFSCTLPNCSKSYKRKDELSRHLRTGHRQRAPKRFECDQCSAAYYRNEELILHKRTHYATPPPLRLCRETYDY